MVYVGKSLVASHNQARNLSSWLWHRLRLRLSGWHHYLLLYELGIEVRKPYELQSDDLGATQLAMNPVYHTKINHAALDLVEIHISNKL